MGPQDRGGWHRGRKWLTAALLLAAAGGWLWRSGQPATGPAQTQGVTRSPSPSDGTGPDAATARGLEPKQVGAPAPAERAYPLFTYLGRSAPNPTLPTATVHAVAVDTAFLDSKQSPFWRTGGGGRIVVPLPDGRSVPVVIQDTETLGADRYVSRGSVEGRPMSRAVFAYNEGVLSAVIEGADVGNWQLTHVGGEAAFYEVDESKIPECGGGLKALVDMDAVQEMARRAALPVGRDEVAVEPAVTGPAVPIGLAATEVVPRSEVRVLVVYTPAVLAAGRTAASVQADIDVGIAQVNDNLARSLVPVTVRLARAALVDYTEPPAPGSGTDRLQEDALTRLRTTTDGFMDEVHALRDQLAADLVCLLLQRNQAGANASAGIAYMLETPGLTSNSQVDAFSVIGYAYLNTAVLSHELGHNFGCSHNREDSGALSSDRTYHGAYAYSYGYRFTGADGRRYRTIMAYDAESGGSYQRVPYFSNPNVTAPSPIDVPVGIAQGLPGQVNNALTIELNAFEVANFRLTPESPVNAGRLIAISTRGFVGTGEQQLIGGFAINPGPAKEVLVRAAGPALVPLNVSGVVADPTMTIFAIGSGAPTAPVADGVNDDWWLQGTGIDATTMATAMAASGAFPFPAGSKDSAVLLTLPPGNYTANITGAQGTTGIALMEVYERNRTTGNKLIDISTRGYIGTGKEMIAGFAIAETPGRPGSTKRVLIRVLGPTLARLGVTGAAEDPQVALYDEAGHLLTTNDDWSSGFSSGDAFQPNTTSTYGEREIFKTGYAPANKRDSALLVDLKPGSYTAIVTPFELLPSQPARPGVALVEVYEIDP